MIVLKSVTANSAVLNLCGKFAEGDAASRLQECGAPHRRWKSNATGPSENAINPAMTEDVPSRTFSQLIWVSFARIALVGTWFLATILILRVLGVEMAGLYFYCQTVIKVTTACIGDPLDMAVMRQGPLLIKSDRPAALQLVRSAFWIRMSLGLIVLLAALLFPALASRALLNNPDYRTVAVLTAAGVLGDFLLRSALGYFQIGEQFGKFLAVDSVWQGGRVVLVLGLVLLHKLSLTTAIGLYVLVPYLAFAVAWLLLPGDVTRFTFPSRGHLSGIFHYGKWMVGGLVMAALYERLDVMLLKHFKGDLAVGFYAAAFTWAVIPDFINGILQTVLGPKIAPAYAAGKFNAMQRTYLRYAVPSGIVFVLMAIPIAAWVIRVFMSPVFLPAANIYRILILGTVFNTVFTPLPEALMNFVAPRRVAVYTGLGLVWVVLGGVLFIPIYGAIGAAVTILSARLLVGCILMIQAHQLALNKQREVAISAARPAMR